MDRYVVIGNPVSHSLSPAIHAQFARQTREAIEYTTLEAPLGDFAAAAARFFADGGAGANVTLPFKMDAFHWAATRTDRAAAAQSANFLARRSGRIEADNTDGFGLIIDLARNQGLELRGIRILLLGAGGAARGVIAPLLEQRPARFVVANRTVERARGLAAQFAARGAIEAVALDAIPEDNFDLVLNATSTSTHGEALRLPRHVLASKGLAYDMAYGAAARPFLHRALAGGMRTSDGLGMLVEQAAESFHLWRGRRPETAEILSELRLRHA
jgi:shikimate dehydrogenase